MTSTDLPSTASVSVQPSPETPAAAASAKPELATASPATRASTVKTSAPVRASRTASRKTPAKTVPAPAAKNIPAAAPAVKIAPKPRTKAPLKAKVTAAQPVPAIAKATAEKASKLKKPKLVRDSFTIPKSEYSVLDDLKQRAAKVANPTKKSELLRAGIKALAAMTDTAFKAALNAVPTIKTGRPAKN